MLRLPVRKSVLSLEIYTFITLVKRGKNGSTGKVVDGGWRDPLKDLRFLPVAIGQTEGRERRGWSGHFQMLSTRRNGLEFFAKVNYVKCQGNSFKFAILFLVGFSLNLFDIYGGVSLKPDEVDD